MRSARWLSWCFGSVLGMVMGALACAECGLGNAPPADAGADGWLSTDAGEKDAGKDVLSYADAGPPGRVFALLLPEDPLIDGTGPVYRWDLTVLKSYGGVDAGPPLAHAYDIVRAGDRLYTACFAPVCLSGLRWFENLSTSVDGPKVLQGDALRLAYSEKTDSLYVLTGYYPDGGGPRLAIHRYDKASTIPEGSGPAAKYELPFPLATPSKLGWPVSRAYGLAAGDDDRVYLVDGTRSSAIIAIENASKTTGTAVPPLVIKDQGGFFVDFSWSFVSLAVDSGRLWMGGATLQGPEVRGYDLATFGPTAPAVVPDLSALEEVNTIDARAGWLFVAGSFAGSPSVVAAFANAGLLQSGASPQHVVKATPSPGGNYYENTTVRYVASRDMLFTATRGKYLEFLGPLANPTNYVVSVWKNDGVQYMLPGFVRIEPVEP